MVHFERFAATAQRLIDKNGRQVTLVELDGAPATPSQPWKGAADPRAAPASTLTLNAVFVEPNSANKLGLSAVSNDLIKRSEQILMLAPGIAVDTTIFHLVTDGAVNWKIQGVEVLRPADEIILAFIGVKR